MQTPPRLRFAIALLGAVLAVGCGNDNSVPRRFNEPLGDSRYGLPVSGSSADLGLLADPASYKPVNVPQPEVGASSFETEEVLAAVRLPATALANMQAEALLNAFVPEQVAALKADPSALQGVFDALSTADKIVFAKLDPKVAESQRKQMQSLPKLLDAVTASLNVKILAPDAASAEIDAAKLGENLRPVAAELLASIPPEALAGMSAGAGGAATPMTPDLMVQQLQSQIPPGLAIPMKKAEGAWRIDLVHTITDEEVELLNEGLGLLRDFVNSIAGKVDASPGPLDEAALQQIGTAAAMEMMPAAMGFFGKLSALDPSALGGVETETIVEPEPAAASAPSEAPAGEAAPPGNNRVPRRP